jgi:hypothetical protein
MKKCFKCGIKKPLTEYYKHKKMADGHLNKCKECAKRDVSKNRECKVEYYREYDAYRYGVLNVRRESRADNLRRYRAENPIANAAHQMVSRAVKDGYLKKPDRCSSCSMFTPSRSLHGHHQDYNMPLDVEWLCAACHATRHPKK